MVNIVKNNPLIALYARVSTTDQSCEMQLRELREYCKRREWEVIEEYVDTGWSGIKVKRPSLNRLMEDARKRKFDVVLVWKFDRWGRSLIDSIKGVQELVSLGIRFIAVTQNIDTDETNPMSKFLLHIMAAFAEMEREIIKERVKAGMLNAKNNGQEFGRPRKLVRMMYILELRSKGMSLKAIAEATGVSAMTICRLLKGEEKRRKGEEKEKTPVAEAET